MSDDQVQELQYVIGCMYRSLGEVAPRPIDEFPARVARSRKGLGIFQDFRGGLDDDHIRHKIDQLIGDTWHIKDHLKSWLKNHRRDPNLVERFVDQDESLQIVADLANARKHGHPLRTYRSDHQPRLGEVGRPCQLQTGSAKGSSAVLTVDPASGQRRLLGTGGATASVVFAGDVFDKSGRKVGDVMDILRQAVAAWRRFIGEQGIRLL